MTQSLWKSRGMLKAAGVALEYGCFGPPPDTSMPLVLLHEGLGCTELWREFPSQLADRTGAGVFVFSRAGYGRSDPVTLPRLTDYMHIEAMDVLPDVLHTMGIEKCVLVGHSDGATIAAIHTGLYQEFRVRGLVMIAPHFFAEEISINAIQEAKVAYESGDLKIRLARYHRDVDVAFYGWNDVWLSDEFQHWNVSEVIDYFRVPVLGIQGSDDEYGTLRQLTEIEERCYSPFEKLVLADCGHSPHLQYQQETTTVITDFYTRLQTMESV